MVRFTSVGGCRKGFLFLLLALCSACDEAPSKVSVERSLPGFDSYRARILELRSSSFEILGVIDEGFAVRVNVRVFQPASDRLAARVQATNALYEIQGAVGKKVSAAVWTYVGEEARDGDLEGMAFYHALTEQYVFKTPEEVRAAQKNTSQ